MTRAGPTMSHVLTSSSENTALLYVWEQVHKVLFFFFFMHAEYHMVRSLSITFSCWVFLMFRAESMMELDSSGSCGWTVVWLCPDQPRSKQSVFNLWLSPGLHESSSHVDLFHSEYGHYRVYIHALYSDERSDVNRQSLGSLTFQHSHCLTL